MKVWQFVLEQFNAGQPVVLLYVLESSGSSPGRQGFKMAVSSGQQMCGTIGGGIMEHKFVELARSRLQANGHNQTVVRQIHNKAATEHQSGMICSGEQTILLQHINQGDLPAIESVVQAEAEKQQGALVINEAGLTFMHTVPEVPFVLHRKGSQFSFIERIGYLNHLHIIGGGHCALAFSKLMRDLDFYIHLYDTRSNLNTVLENTFAHKIIHLHSYSDLNEHLHSGDNIYVVIMTFGYRTDDEALRSLAGKKFKYLGMLGSESKVMQMRNAYKAENIDPDLLKQLHSPVGLQIKSQTATEIAISIAAEIISVKNRS